VQDAPAAAFEFDALLGANGPTADQIALVMPTSLCSGQVARVLAEHLNEQRPANCPVSRFVALVHTEGCGSANSDDLFLQTLAGHLAHRFTAHALMLEHGCERTHNDAVRHYLARIGRGVEDIGFASVQLDGGMQAVHEKAQEWFEQAMAGNSWPRSSAAGVADLRIALLASGELPDPIARAFAALAGGIVAGGGTVVIAQDGALARSAVFREALLPAPAGVHPTLAYGQHALTPGLHVMQSPTQVPVEVVTGLGGTGVEIMLTHVGDTPIACHPMIAMLQFSIDDQVRERFDGDLDLQLDVSMSTTALRDCLLERISDVLSRRYTPRLSGYGMSNFQLTRGLLGISM
jgi:altronate dehydratase